MPYILLGILGFWIALAAMKAFARANPASLARLLKQAAGLLALAAAFGLLLLGRLGFAFALGAFGFWLLGVSGTPMSWFRSVGRGTGNKSSRVRSAMVEMELDHETGKMRGLILAGPDEGKWLDDLTRPQCEAVYVLCLTDDPEGARLLEAYLDRRFPGWRAAGEGDGDTGRSDGSGQSSGAMSEDQAYQVLGLQKGAPREAIVQSHRALMQKLHPDHGGSTDLAARVNEAKDVLLRRHV
ncbi:hypothetical protein [Methyloferula stellata]|uniref:hypothetical protein n=1 Tax=Methyloferula stellata TaxID=876270 RepID=UPI00036C1BE9|nr:hypothetical protein [Methyloferula stellata]